MSGTLGITADRRRSLIVLALVGALALAACGGSASQAPASGVGATASPEPTASGATLAPEPTATPDGSAEPGNGDTAFQAATTALDALDSYAFRVEMSSSSTSAGTTTTTNSLMTGVVQNQPVEASSLVQQDLDADGNVTSGTETIVIGDSAWLRNVGDATWTALPAAQAAPFIQSMAAFRPEQLFSLYFSGIGGDFTEEGTETVNGVETTRYTGNEAIGALLGAISGFQGTWTSQVWIAKDGGFLVRSEASSQAATGSEAGGFSVVVDITDPNSAEPIEPPV